MENKKNNQISQLISDAIKSYIEADRSNRSIRQIGLRSEVSYGYIQRLSQNEISSEKLDPVKIYQILKVVKNLDFANEIIGENPDWERKVNMWRGLDKFLSRKSHHAKDIEQTILEDEHNIVAFILACNHPSWTTFSQLLKVGGIPLQNAAKRLIEKGVLIEQNDTIKLKKRIDEEWFISFSKKNLKTILPALIRHYDYERKHPKNYISLATGSFSAEFLEEAQHKIDNLKQWFATERLKPENAGPYDSFLGMVLDVFTK